jgi:nucleotide-binding universal stress UspA family protein
MTPHRIVVPLDGRLASETALPPAVEFARKSGGTLYLLRVLGTAEAGAGTSVRQRAAVQRAERYLAATRRRLASDNGVAASTAVWSGSPAAAIVKAADLIDADMIIMAAGGDTGPPRTMVGSVVERVLRGTKRPVLVVTPAETVADTSLGDAAPLPDRTDIALVPAVSATARPPARRPLPPSEVYRDAVSKLQAREREALRLVRTVHEGAKNLERWQAVHVTHSGAGFPKEVTMTGRMIDGSSWPTARQLGDTLGAWHSAAEAARVAWARLPEEDRAILPAPP